MLPTSVRINTTARLHMGFFDLNGSHGRRFGSIGLSLDAPATSFVAARAATLEAEGPGAQRALAYARRFADRMDLRDGVRFHMESEIPTHAGLGSGTQMALAVGAAMARLYGLSSSLPEIAAVMERGARSGIGIGAFESGGLLVDGGRGAETVVPPIISRMDFPADWRVLLIFDLQAVGVHGKQEISAFRELPVFPDALAERISHRVLLQALPAVAERNLQVFGDAIYEIQCILGDYFAVAQGGGRFTSPSVTEVLAALRAEGVAGVGQSSWGPTGFAIVGSESEGQRWLGELRQRYGKKSNLSFMLCAARNQGSEVQVIYEKNPLPIV
jgi:beta-ribofuranosylaminobenzene 5'-phosphate synthase